VYIRQRTLAMLLRTMRIDPKVAKMLDDLQSL